MKWIWVVSYKPAIGSGLAGQGFDWYYNYGWAIAKLVDLAHEDTKYDLALVRVAVPTHFYAYEITPYLEAHPELYFVPDQKEEDDGQGESLEDGQLSDTLPGA